MDDVAGCGVGEGVDEADNVVDVGGVCQLNVPQAESEYLLHQSPDKCVSNISCIC